MSSVPTPSDKISRTELEPQRVGTEGTVDSSLNEAPQLTPVHKTPAHVDNTDYGYRGDVEEHYSRVFHRDNPGRIVATFVGENHRADAQAFCDWCQTRDGQPG